MNCQKGDLCRVLSNRTTDFGGISDRFVVVDQLEINECKDPSWTLQGGPMYTIQGIDVQCIPDAWLKPIGKPPETAVDEMVLRNPVRHGEPA